MACRSNRRPASNERQLQRFSQHGRKGLLKKHKSINVVSSPEELDPHSMVARSGAKVAISVPPPLARTVALSRMEPSRGRLLNIARRTGAAVIDPVAFLCNESCPAFDAAGQLVYKDYDHLSPATLARIRYLDATLQPLP